MELPTSSKHPTHILVVEDNPGDAALVLELLDDTDLTFEPTVVTSCSEPSST